MLMLRSAIQLFWGVEPVPYHSGIERPLVFFDELRIPQRHIWMIAARSSAGGGAPPLPLRTRIGRAMRGVSDDPDLARVTGIATERVILVDLARSARALAAVAGVFLGMDTQVQSQYGLGPAAADVRRRHPGRHRQPYGAVAGGLVIGLAEELSTYPWIGDARCSRPATSRGSPSPSWWSLLIWRPTGLFKGRVF